MVRQTGLFRLIHQFLGRLGSIWVEGVIRFRRGRLKWATFFLSLGHTTKKSLSFLFVTTAQGHKLLCEFSFVCELLGLSMRTGGSRPLRQHVRILVGLLCIRTLSASKGQHVRGFLWALKTNKKSRIETFLHKLQKIPSQNTLVLLLECTRNRHNSSL